MRTGADLAYVAYLASQLILSNPAITLRIYSHWVPGTRRITTSILDAESANDRQTLEEIGGVEKGGSAVNP